MTEDLKKSTAKCPKCRSNDIYIIEVWNGATITWEQENGTFDKSDGTLADGNPAGLEGRCDCGHRWKMRGKFQINDIIKDTP